METKEVQLHEEYGDTVLAEAKSIVIVDDTTRELATEFTANARKAIKAVEAELKPDIENAHKLHKDLLARLKRLTAPIKKAQGIVDDEIKRDWLEREKLRKGEERRVRDEEEKERKRQEEILLLETEQAIVAGNIDKAEELLDSTVVVVSPSPPVAPIKRTTESQSGSATVRKDIIVRVQDKKAIIKAVLGGKLPDTLIVIDLGAAKRYAKAAGKVYMQGFVIEETAVISGRVR